MGSVGFFRPLGHCISPGGWLVGVSARLQDVAQGYRVNNVHVYYPFTCVYRVVHEWLLYYTRKSAVQVMHTVDPALCFAREPKHIYPQYVLINMAS